MRVRHNARKTSYAGVTLIGGYMYQKISLILLSSVFASSIAFADAARDALVDLGVSEGIQKTVQAEASLTDGKAYVYKVDGKAVLVKSGSPIEANVKVGDLIQPGDKILTEKNASVAIAFDYLKKNAVQIPSETQAVFNSIEPTDIKLEDGSVFSAVDGLVKGSSWKVTTPAAVAAVRGTVYLVSYESSNGEFFAATVDVPDDGKTSAIEIQPIDGKGEAFVPEGKEISLREGEAPSNEMVQDLKPEVVTEIKQFFEVLKTERTESDKDGGNNNGGNGPNGPSGPTGPSGNMPGSGGPMGGSTGTQAGGMTNNPAMGMFPPAGTFDPSKGPAGMTTFDPANANSTGNNPPPGMTAPMGGGGLAGFMPETMKMDGMGAAGPNIGGSASTMTTDGFGTALAGGFTGGMSEGPGMVENFGSGPTDSFGGQMDTFSGPPGGEFGTFSSGGMYETAGIYLPPLDPITDTTTATGGCLASDPNCTGGSTIGCTAGTSPDGSGGCH